MIPILYGETETSFTSNGLGRLSDAISCVVTEERNGEFELEMDYPVGGAHYSDIQKSRIISAVPADGKGRQPFRIYRISRPINGIVTIYAEHISYQLSLIPVMPFTAGSAAEAVVAMESNAVGTLPFALWTDITTVANYNQRIPKSFRACLGGSQGSFLDTYGGEFEWDNWTVKIHARRGADRGVTIRYGKNLTDLVQEENIQDTYTGILPYWYSEEQETLVTLPEKIIMSSNASLYPFNRVLPYDFSSCFSSQPTEAQLRQAAQSYVTSNNIGVPKVSLKVEFAALWQTEEYKNVANQERVNLCDSVTVEFEKLGVSAKAKVIKAKYNVLLERYDSIEIGDAKSSFSDTFVKAQEETEKQIEEANSNVQKAVDKATELITHGFGGYVTYKPDANGEYNEILIMDTKDTATATKVWRWNQNGLGYSSNGYNGPYTTAITSDGHIVANFVDTGVLSANIVKAGVLSDESGNTTLNMATGALNAKKLSVTSTNFTLTETGNITAINASLINVSASGSLSTEGTVYERPSSISTDYEPHIVKTSIQNGGIDFYRDGTYAGSISTVGGISEESYDAPVYYYRKHTLDILSAIDGISFSLYQEDEDNPGNYKNYYYLTVNNGLAPGGYDETFYASGDVRVVGGIRPNNVEVWNNSGSIKMNYGTFQSNPALYVHGCLVLRDSSGGNVCDLKVDGAKNRIVRTKNYGTLELSAMESTCAVFSDLGSGVIDDDGVSYVFISPEFSETVDLSHNYQVFVCPVGKSSQLWVEKQTDYFVVHGEPGCDFDWIIYARQSGYATDYLNRFDGDDGQEETEKQNYSGYTPDIIQSMIEVDKYDDGIDKLADDYMQKYESEVNDYDY